MWMCVCENAFQCTASLFALLNDVLPSERWWEVVLLKIFFWKTWHATPAAFTVGCCSFYTLLVFTQQQKQYKCIHFQMLFGILLLIPLFLFRMLWEFQVTLPSQPNSHLSWFYFENLWKKWQMFSVTVYLHISSIVSKKIHTHTQLEMLEMERIL